MRFHRWIAFHEPIVPGLALIPDGYVEFTAPDGIVSSFLEVDLGHESLRVWKEKTHHYLQLALSGEYERQFMQSRFRVLVLANSERRLKSIRSAVAEITEKIFWFATLDAVHREFFGHIWMRPGNEAQQPFIETTP